MVGAVSNVVSNKIANAGVMAALLVVAIHVAGRSYEVRSLMWFWEHFVHYGICLIAVPAFFTFSGYFLARHVGEYGWWREECHKRIRTLLVPYLSCAFFYALLIAMTSVTANVIHGRMLGIELFGLKYWLKAVGCLPYDWPQLVPLWYLRSLMLFVVVSPIILWYVKRFKGAGLAFLWVLSLLVGFCSITPGRLILFLAKFVSVSGLLYFSVGVYLRVFGITGFSSRKSRAYLYVCAGLMCIVVSICLQLITGYEAHRVCRHLFVPLLLIGLWYFVPSEKFPAWLIRSAFPMYLLHIPLWFVIGFLMPLSDATIFGWLTKWIIGIVGAVVISVSLRRFANPIAQIVFGGR